MRTVILILIIVILAVIAAIATGFLDINQIRGAQAPQVSATHNGIVAKGGQAPAFDVADRVGQGRQQGDDGEGPGARGPKAGRKPGRSGRPTTPNS